jgi:predicted GNAT superfamily acetyltransferase
MLVLRDLHTIDEFRHVVELERQIWEYSDLADVVTVPVFIITVKRGAILIGAFDEHDRMVGFVYSLVGMKNGKPMQWSHMAGVLAEYRGQGLGRDLKLAQRERALAAGFDLIEWTFDPLQAANAHLNFRKLGVVCDDYAENIYGESSSVLHRGTPTDRLVVQWTIRDIHVERCLRNEPRNLPAGEDGVSIEIPGAFTEMQREAPDTALEWRMRTRESFQRHFAQGYRAVDFELHGARRGGGHYLLARRELPHQGSAGSDVLPRRP